jgi:predicted 2-oxoglutarate/Fe(II)-dependent dioxygenase YbiX/peroxiredoxin
MLEPGDPAPWFSGRTTKRSDFHFDTAAGRYLVLCFFGTAAHPASAAALASLLRRRNFFDDQSFAFFGVSTDRDDQETGRIVQMLPGIRYFLDHDGAICRKFGFPLNDDGQLHPQTGAWLVLDPNLRVLATAPLASSEQVFSYLTALPPVASYAGPAFRAPVLVVPRVFSPAFCAELIRGYDEDGGEPSGFVKEIGGRTTLVEDTSFKRRRDFLIADQAIRSRAREALRRRLFPEIVKAFQFQVTRIERYIVACYDATTGGFFRPHRDNTTRGTAHRKFAVTINLNAESYAGGDLRFPEYGPHPYRAPTGGAVVFSCSLLHEATPVTEGRRYAFLPFLYDDESAQVRQQNNRFLDSTLSSYAPNKPPQTPPADA